MRFLAPPVVVLTFLPIITYADSGGSPDGSNYFGNGSSDQEVLIDSDSYHIRGGTTDQGNSQNNSLRVIGGNITGQTAAAESFWATLKRETLPVKQCFNSRAEAQAQIQQWIFYYNGNVRTQS